MAFEDGAFNLIIAIVACSGVFAYLGINVGGSDNSPNARGTNNFPLKLFFLVMSLTFLLGAVGVSLLITVNACGGVCSTEQQRVVDVAMWVMVTLVFSWLFIVGYFNILFIKWVLYYLNTKRTKQAILESDYEK